MEGVPRITEISPLADYDRKIVGDPHYDCLEGVVSRNHEIQERVGKLADQIMRDYGGEVPVFLCVMRGAKEFYDTLISGLKRRGMDITDADKSKFKTSSYVENASTGQVTIDGLDYTHIKDRHVIVVEDIVDTGVTMENIVNALHDGHKTNKPKSVKVATFFHKPGGRAPGANPQMDYIGFEIPNFYVMGFGLDKDNDDATRKYPHVYACKTAKKIEQAPLPETQPQAL